MPNDWFQFREFKIEQGNCAMKVSTDACIFGAYVATVAPAWGPIRRVLDIGTGTGLLSLMIAQKLRYAVIDALEIDPDACLQAAANFRKAQWAAGRLNVIREALQQWKGPPETWAGYDLLVCNPPFFKNHLEAVAPNRNVARHHIRLSSADLCSAAMRWLAPKGMLAMLYPAMGWAAFYHTAVSKGLYLHRRVDIYPRRHQPCNRHIGLWTKQAVPLRTDSIVIYGQDDQYTDAFKALLKDYYLYL